MLNGSNVPSARSMKTYGVVPILKTTNIREPIRLNPSPINDVSSLPGVLLRGKQLSKSSLLLSSPEGGNKPDKIASGCWIASKQDSD